MNIKLFKVTWDNFDVDLCLTVKVDLDIVSDEDLFQINNFFSESYERLQDSDGNILHTVLKMLACQCFLLAVQHDYNVRGIVSLFDWDNKFGGGQEGWPKMDGSAGIELIACDILRFEDSDMAVLEITDKEQENE